MFTTGKIIFAGLFVVVFIIAMFWSYQKDKQINKIHFKGASKTLFYIVLVIGLLFLFVKMRHLL
jgi:uncharacterized membrane protein YtjA (UPF0391 family)